MLKCPECGSEDVETYNALRVSLYTMETNLTLKRLWDRLASDPYDEGQAEVILEQHLECTECGHEWEAK
jgi:hypothetical protein